MDNWWFLLQEKDTQVRGIANELNRDSEMQCNIQSKGVAYMSLLFGAIWLPLQWAVYSWKKKILMVLFLIALFKDLYICDLTLLCLPFFFFVFYHSPAFKTFKLWIIIKITFKTVKLNLYMLLQIINSCYDIFVLSFIYIFFQIFIIS